MLEITIKNNLPVQLKGQPLRLIDRWRVGGKWWRGESPRDYYRVEYKGKLLDIYKTPRGGGEVWCLAKPHA